MVIADPIEINNYDRVILPGVGSFAAGMQQLKDEGWDSAITQYVKRDVKFLGICLGMQLLFESSSEFIEEEGLGLLSGNVTQFIPKKHMPVPHMGWNSFTRNRPHELLANIKDGIDVYFVHSFYVNPKNDSDVLATTEYGINFPSIVLKENILGVQFHPEKSFPAGIQLLRNFNSW
jgi:glutamine amidotransferase